MSGNREAGAANGDRDQSTRASVEVILSFLTRGACYCNLHSRVFVRKCARSLQLGSSSQLAWLFVRALTALYLSRLSFTF